jgi:phenylpyruvate tautomerase PptA (4-oxalocrotonate tautomerase family)
MPTYTLTVPEGQLSPHQKAWVAAAITRTHAEVTGAPSSFAQVIVNEVKSGNYFVGGVPLQGDHIFLHGHIRGGRSSEHKHALLVRLIESIAEAADVTAGHIWAYIDDLQWSQMAEFGHILPEPGKEPAWAAALPESERQRMESIGIRAPAI